MRLSRISLLFLLLGVFGSAPHAVAAVADPIAHVAEGRLEGREAGGVRAFKAIPFAVPPIGPLRWTSPQPPASWAGVRDVGDFGPACLQVTGAMPDLPQSEDCLTLNIWAPSTPRARRLPVMLWVHGGGFVVGSGRLFDGASLARRGVVLVTINYRLGRLGLFAHPGLVAEAGTGRLPTTV